MYRGKLTCDKGVVLHRVGEKQAHLETSILRGPREMNASSSSSSLI